MLLQRFNTRLPSTVIHAPWALSTVRGRASNPAWSSVASSVVRKSQSVIGLFLLHWRPARRQAVCNSGRRARRGSKARRGCRANAAATRERPAPRWSLVTEQGSDTLIGRQTGIGGDQFNQAIRLEDRLHHRFAEFDGSDLAATLHALEMGLQRGHHRCDSATQDGAHLSASPACGRGRY